MKKTMRTNFIELLNNQVEIPIIQRDYAQGRTDSKTNKVRKDFLDVLFEFIKRKLSTETNAEEMELDFIYGFNELDDKYSTFIPIDGQQRLTTLWLIYWLVSVKEKDKIPDDKKAFLTNFVYETRHSTTQFCKKLITSNLTLLEETISRQIKNESWYFETWDFDPSIQAMLVVLDDILKRYNELNSNNVWQVICHKSCPFYFYKLNMDKVGLTDDLYIKMNSRGKPLTEFEYFKAGFSDIISETKQKQRFDQSIDGLWMHTIWHIVFESGLIQEDDDIALIVDNAFLNLFNFLTSVISFKKQFKTKNDTYYIDTVDTPELIKVIYSDSDNQDFLFNSLDAISEQQKKDPAFWNDIFYFRKSSLSANKTRLFFQHSEPNLLKRCLFYFTEYKGLTLPEQILLLGCITHLKTSQPDINKRLRHVRNLVVNSENELRESILGNSFGEVENYIMNGDLNVFKNFKTDQIEEEKRKEQFLHQYPADSDILYQLEDSDILRGSISLFLLDTEFGKRAKKFLEIFDDEDFISEFRQKSKMLLCFGDYSQDDGTMTNLMSGTKSIIRSFLTLPGYNKTQFLSKTWPVLRDCLDYFIINSAISAENMISDTLLHYASNTKDWKYYFIKYDSFREGNHYGYYAWRDEQYCIWKMGKKQYNGYHWDPFLYEIYNSVNSANINLDAFGAKLIVNSNENKILVSSIANGFLFENDISNGVTNSILEDLIKKSFLSNDCKLIIPQNNDGIDLEDRIEKLKVLILNLI